MKRLSLAELKAKSANDVIFNLESIKGGNTASCHNPPGSEKAVAVPDGVRVAKPGGSI